MAPYDPIPYALLAKGAYTRPHDIDVGSFRARFDDSPLGTCQSIAGTNNIRTALTDIEALVPTFVPELGAWVPASFWAAIAGASNEIDDLRQYRSPKVLGGHSLGAVLALLEGARLCAAGRPPQAIFGFAPPRSEMGNHLAKLFAAHGVAVQLYRLGDDEVTNLPPAYSHPAPLNQLAHPWAPLDELEVHSIDHIITALGGTVPA